MPVSPLASTDLAEDKQSDKEEAMLVDGGADDTEAMGDSSDDEVTVVESEFENPFLDHTPSPSIGVEGPTIETETLDEFVTTPYLDQFGLAFNQKYKLIICQPCGAGMPLVATHQHLKTTECKRMIWQEHSGGWNFLIHPLLRGSPQSQCLSKKSPSHFKRQT